MVNCKTIIIDYLKNNGYDGLFNPGDCGCELSDLIPCSEDPSNCRPGYKIFPPIDKDAEFDFYICENKDDKPWER